MVLQEVAAIAARTTEDITLQILTLLRYAEFRMLEMLNFKSYKNIVICSILKILAKIILNFYDNNDNFVSLCVCQNYTP